MSFLRKLLRKAARSFFRCKYAAVCGHYKPDGFTCNHPTAEDGYCGIYRRLERENYKKNSREEEKE